MDLQKPFHVHWSDLNYHLRQTYTIFDNKKLYYAVVALLMFGGEKAPEGYPKDVKPDDPLQTYIVDYMEEFQDLNYDQLAWSMFFTSFFPYHSGRCCDKLRVAKRIAWSPKWTPAGSELLSRIPVHKIECLQQFSNTALPYIPPSSCVSLYGSRDNMFVSLPESMYHTIGLRYLSRNGLLNVTESHKDASVLFACKEWETGLQFIRHKIHEEKEYPTRQISWFDVDIPSCSPPENDQLDIPSISKRTPGRVALNTLPLHQSAILWWMRAREFIPPKEWLGVRINGYWFSPFVHEPKDSPKGGVIACGPGVGIVAPILRLKQNGTTIVIAHPNLVSNWIENDVVAYTFDELMDADRLIQTTRLIIDVKQFTSEQLKYLDQCQAKIIWWLAHPSVDICLAKRICRWDVKVSQRLTTETFILARQLILHIDCETSHFLRYIMCKPNKAESAALKHWKKQVNQLHMRKEFFTEAWNIEDFGELTSDDHLNNFQRRHIQSNLLPVFNSADICPNTAESNTCHVCHQIPNDPKTFFVCGHCFCHSCCLQVSQCPICRKHTPVIYGQPYESKMATSIQCKKRKFKSWIRNKDKSNMVVICPPEISDMSDMPRDVRYDVSADGYHGKTLVFWSLPHSDESLNMPHSDNDVYLMVLSDWVASFWMERNNMNRTDMMREWIRHKLK